MTANITQFIPPIHCLLIPKKRGDHKLQFFLYIRLDKINKVDNKRFYILYSCNVNRIQYYVYYSEPRTQRLHYVMLNTMFFRSLDAVFSLSYNAAQKY